MSGLVVIGALLEVGGIGVALWGVDDLSRELFPGRLLPHRALREWFDRRVLRRKSAVTLGVASTEIGLLWGHARGQSLPPRPADDAELNEWVAFLERRLANIDEGLVWSREDLKEAVAKLGARIEAEASARSAADEERDDKLRRVMGGEEGGGLVKTFWGLSATALGALLQAIASLVG